jgi:putative membrane-bound dehydrogenase-like protein
MAQTQLGEQVDRYNPWYPNQSFPALTTPQWVGEEEVDAVVILAIDDMRDSAKYEHYLRPILKRLKEIDGRAPVSIMTCDAKPDDPQLQSWLEEGLSIECHTADHPCPILQNGDLPQARSTYDRCIDLLNRIPGNQPVAFRTPCCDSLNTVSPRFYAEIFGGTTPAGHSLQIDSSVFNFFTTDDPSIPRELLTDKNGKDRFWKYMPRNTQFKGITHDNFVNYICNYPYPYLIGDNCWQFPCVAPSDWSAQHLHGVNNPETVSDWQAALDITVHKQGVFCLVFHPHGWITAEQIVELIDHAVTRHGSRVKFLNFREAADRLNQNLTDGRTVREAEPQQIARLAHRDFRRQHPSPSDFSSLPESTLAALANAEPSVFQKGEGHSGAFLHDGAVYWQNEDTADQPGLVRHTPLTTLTSARQHADTIADLPPVLVGAAVVDITPDYPVRLSGYAARSTEATEVAGRLHVRALAIGGSSAGLAAGTVDSCLQQPLTVLLTVDNCGVPLAVTEKVHERLARDVGLQRQRFAVSSSHSHSAPWLQGFAPLILKDLPEDQQARLDRYEDELVEHMVAAVKSALASRRPGHLSLGHGHVGFAKNRRSVQSGQWVGFGEDESGPVDRRLSLLAAHDLDGELIAVLSNYACHATTETGQLNKLSGDWPGYACDMIEADHPGAVALVAIGCGADANPSPRGTNALARQHGRELADEVTRLLQGGSNTTQSIPEGEALLRRIDPRLECRITTIALPHGPLPSRAEWEQRAERNDAQGAHARYFLAMLDSGQSIPDSVPEYPVQTWCFGDSLAMVFLAGEVVVDYDIRMNEMFDGDRLWINAYCNDVPCYIASKRILREGGYEADSSMLYYARPTRLAPEAEDLICDTVQKLLPHDFYSESLRVDFPAPLPPDEAVISFTTRPELRVELVASEPLIRDPVAFDWDVQGRLWVVEMGDYPSGVPGSEEGQAATAGGRIRVLEDDDGDGRYDRATTFLDGLPFPTGICHWRDGVLITAAPDILFAQDTNGDLQADTRRVLYTGFGEGNQQHRVNGLRWGLDGWVYIGNGDSGGSIAVAGQVLPSERSGNDASTHVTTSVDVRGHDVRIQPDAGGIDVVAGPTQFGRERDDFGNWFGNNNSNPIWHYALEDRYLRRNPHAAAASLKRQIAVVPGAAPVYPISRTLARFNDFHAANRFTSACSTSIYRDHLLGEQFYGNAFVSEPVHNLVSRLVLSPDGSSFRAARATDEQSSEFLASNDNWFRPTMVRTGPDGALYVADMYRFVIEHPTWIPQEYQRKLNLRAGDQLGRIYRVVPSRGCCGSSVKPSASTPQPEADGRTFLTAALPRITTQALAARLSSPNGWWRDTAHRMLLHDRDPAAIPVLLELLEQQNTTPAATVQVMSALRQLTENSDTAARIATVTDTIVDRLSSGDPQVRRHALRLLESSIDDPSIVADGMLEKLAQDDNEGVLLQLACILGETTRPIAPRLLADVLKSHGERELIVSAALSSLNAGNIGSVLTAYSEAVDLQGDSVLGQLIGQAAAMGAADAVITPLTRMLTQLAGEPLSADAAAWNSAQASIRQLQRHAVVASAVRKSSQLDAAWHSAIEKAFHLVHQETSPPDLREAALTFAATSRPVTADQADALLALLSPRTPDNVQLAVVSAIAGSSKDATAARLLNQWSRCGPATRAAIVDQLLQRTTRTRLLLDAIQAQQVQVSDLTAVHRDRLVGHRDPAVRETAEALLQSGESNRAALVERWQQQLAAVAGDAATGQLVFRKRCSTCHRLQDEGRAVGADLAALRDRSTGALLTAILDPNRAVEAKFLSYTVVTREGLTHAGMLLQETSNSMTLLAADGKETTVLRHDIDEFFASNKSLMPEGLEQDLSPQDMADVIAYVQNAGSAWKQFEGNLPTTITARQDGTLTLPAHAAEIYGPSLVFEQQHGNLGWWQSTEDYAVWQIEVPRSGHWTVEFEYACDNGTAGNLLRLSTGTRMLTARVPGSGTWNDYRHWTAGTIDLHRGTRQLIVSAPEVPSSALIDLKSIRLIPPD